MKIASKIENEKDVIVTFTNNEENTYELQYNILNPSFYLMLMNSQKMAKYVKNPEKYQTYFFKFVEHFGTLLGEDTFSDLNEFYIESDESFDMMVLVEEVIGGLSNVESEEEVKKP